MDGFTYYNIFDTKGMEYIVIIAFLLLLIPFWLMLTRKEAVKRQIRAVLGVLSPGILKVPQGVFHSPHHTWTFLERNGKARIGLDDLLMHITGDVNLTFHKQEGEKVRKGELVAEITEDGKTLNVYSPISGKIVSANAELQSQREVLSADPYGKAWMYKLVPSAWKEEVSTYYLAGEANAWLEEEIVRYKDFLAVNLGGHKKESVYPILQDGGEVMDHSLSAMPGEIWQSFQKEFLQPGQ
jgi:glycine cleavage system H protein